MSQRPALWMHRTRRFWFGLAIIFLLTAFWVGSGFIQIEVEYENGNLANELEVVLDISGGSLFFKIERAIDPTLKGLPETPDWSFSYDRLTWFSPIPEFDFDRDPDGYDLEATLPLWVPLLLWIILWPIWMHRADKKEAEIFATPTPDA